MKALKKVGNILVNLKKAWKTQPKIRKYVISFILAFLVVSPRYIFLGIMLFIAAVSTIPGWAYYVIILGIVFFIKYRKPIKEHHARRISRRKEKRSAKAAKKNKRKLVLSKRRKRKAKEIEAAMQA